MTQEEIAKFQENQRKIVDKILSLEKEIGDVKSLHMETIALYSESIKKVDGLKTALIGAGLLTVEGTDLHQSFDPPKNGIIATSQGRQN